MGRAKAYKAARRVAAMVAADAPAFLPTPPSWTERLPFIGKRIRAKRERLDIIRLQLHREAIKHAAKKVAHRLAE
jgi:hypothetical protein